MLRKCALGMLIAAVALFVYSLVHDSSQLTEASSVLSGIALVLALVSDSQKRKSRHL